jgi:hypothetical protein
MGILVKAEAISWSSGCSTLIGIMLPDGLLLIKLGEELLERGFCHRMRDYQLHISV